MDKQKFDKEFIRLYEQGLNDNEISKLLNCSREKIRQYRIKKNLKSNFSYDSFKKIDYDKVTELVKTNHSDLEISNLLNCSKDGIYSIRKKLNIERRNLNINEPIIFNKKQKEILFGCLLGDGSLSLQGKNPRFKSSHSLKQKDYNLYKYSFFKPYGTHKEYKRKTPDKRNGNIYSESVFSIGANESFFEFYNMFYKETKQIPLKYLKKYYTPLSIAIHFMDDGCKEECGYSLATMCFDRENVVGFVKFLKDEYSLECSIRKTGSVYIKSKSKNNFTKIIEPYVCNSMKYKLHKVT